MKEKKPLRLRRWVIVSNLAGQEQVRYFFTEPEVRLELEILKKQLPTELAPYPDDGVERYYGFFEGEDYGIEIRQLTANDAVQRYPRTVGHLICHSLGYCTPVFAGRLVLIAARNGTDWCEWISTCYRSDPWPALVAAIEERHTHRGYMADIQRARSIVEAVRRGGPEPLLATWF
jgi:hypothetical protein